MSQPTKVGLRTRVLQRHAVKLYDALKDVVERGGCLMGSLCTGPYRKPVNMRTCPGCWALYNANVALRRAGITVERTS